MKARLLVVDDDKATRKALSSLLQAEGFDVRACAGGPEALDCMRAGAYDALVTDYEMPEMNGVELIRCVRHIAPDLCAIVVSGREAPSSVPEGVGWFPKPVPLDRLVAMLRERGATAG